MKIDIPDFDLSALGRMFVDLVYGMCLFGATTLLCYFTTMTLIANNLLPNPQERTSNEQRK
jgi:hypothetical protein